MTDQSVGTSRIHCPVENSSTTNTTPLTSHRMSSDWCSHRLMLILRFGLPFGLQNTVGRF